MKFHKRVLASSYSRHADYESLRDQDNGYKFECSDCGEILSFPYSEVVESSGSWGDRYDKESVAKIRDYFAMNIVGKTPDGGWLSVLEIKCLECPAEYFIYAGVKETSNSVYRVVIQSIAQFSR